MLRRCGDGLFDQSAADADLMRYLRMLTGPVFRYLCEKADGALGGVPCAARAAEVDEVSEGGVHVIERRESVLVGPQRPVQGRVFLIEPRREDQEQVRHRLLQHSIKGAPENVKRTYS